jgi:hypothetical protein
MARNQTAGQKLRAALDAALAAEAEATGRPGLAWDDRELARIAAAVAAADRAAELERLIAAELARDEVRPSVYAKLAGEQRQQHTAISDNLRWLDLEQFAALPPSPQHQAAGRRGGGRRSGPARIGRPGVA